jgi:hypothetical protein
MVLNTTYGIEEGLGTIITIGMIWMYQKLKKEEIAGKIITLLGILLGTFGTVYSEELYNRSCIKILNKLAAKERIGILDRMEAKAYMQLQKDFSGESLYTSPVHAGIRINYRLLDKRERLERQKEYIKSLNYASNTLSKYLMLRKEIEEKEKFLKWQWERVEYGIEYKRDIWEEQIKLEIKKAQLKAMHNYFIAIGISKKLLDKCYRGR